LEPPWDYRCYHIQPNGHILAVEPFKACSDSEASLFARNIATARQWYGYELWQLARRVAVQELQIPAEPLAA
jgi:hypothetical protein